MQPSHSFTSVSSLLNTLQSSVSIRRGLAAIALGMAVTWGSSAQAENAASAPAELKSVLTQIDTAASGENLQGVLQFYSPTFSTSDGLQRDSFEKALVDLWKRFEGLRYQTELVAWKQAGNGFEVETITRVMGTQPIDDRKLILSATIRSRQMVSNNQITKQDILTEESQLSSGTKPPNVDIKLPEKVKVGQEFAFDAVLQEPLGESILLGGAFEKPVNPKDYAQGSTGSLDLSVLSSGGLFKIGQAPKTPQTLWISAVFLREGGINIFTRRLKVVTE
jgi:hypothetical protein